MKKIRYLILGLVFACLGLTSFSSANSITLTGNLVYGGADCGRNNFPINIPIPIQSPTVGSSSNVDIICGYKTSGIRAFNGLKVYFNYGSSIQNEDLISTTCPSEYSNGYTCYGGSAYSNSVYLSFLLGEDYSGLPCKFDYFCSFEGNSVIQEATPCPTCPTCEDCSSIQESLSGCLEDYDSVSNMNQSLSDELEACLESGGDGCNPETDTGCVEGAIMPLLSWSVGLDSFSTPIINNLTLPTNYKGKLVDGVLSISSINQNLSIDDADYGNIKDSFVNIVLYIFGVGLMLILVYYIKFYFFNIKD